MIERSPWRTWKNRLRTSGKQLRPRWNRMLGTARTMLRPRSLSLQMSLIAVTIAVCAIIATALIAAFAVTTSFSSYTKNVLQRSAQNEAFRISDLMVEHGYSLPNAVTHDLAFKFLSNAPNANNSQTWVIGADGSGATDALIWPLTPAKFDMGTPRI